MTRCCERLPQQVEGMVCAVSVTLAFAGEDAGQPGAALCEGLTKIIETLLAMSRGVVSRLAIGYCTRSDDRAMPRCGDDEALVRELGDGSVGCAWCDAIGSGQIACRRNCCTARKLAGCDLAA